MRRTLTKLPYPAIGRSTTTSISAAFSTSSSDNNGRGRGRGSPTHFQFTADPRSEDSAPTPTLQPQGHGKPLPSFHNSNDKSTPPLGRGRGATSHPQPGNRKLPFLFVEDQKPQTTQSQPPKDSGVPQNFVQALSGSGRGKPVSAAPPPSENRHLRPREPPQPFKPHTLQPSPPATPAERGPSLTQEEKVRKAKEILSQGESVRADDEVTRGGRGGGRGRGRGRGRGERGREGYDMRRREGYDKRGREEDEEEDKFLIDLGEDDPEAEEKVAQKLGPEIMDKLTEGIEEISHSVLPSPLDDALIDAWDTNLAIECEPEYFMEEFGTNPDIDEKPPMSLRDALEKVKPFIMAYEGIRTHEEWEEAIEETMKTVPLMKEIVDHYSGPDRVTAKQQNEELERVAKTLPASAPASVKRFTDRALLSLQSNPGWGFDKKCQFMDKLVMEVSKQHK